MKTTYSNQVLMITASNKEEMAFVEAVAMILEKCSALCDYTTEHNSVILHNDTYSIKEMTEKFNWAKSQVLGNS